MDLDLQDAFKNSPEGFSMEASGFPPPMLGDFYREPDDICRGLTLPAQSSEGLPMDLPMDGCFALKGSDFYGSSDVVRGVSLPSDFQQYGLGADFAPPPFGYDMDLKNTFPQATMQNGERFQQGDLAWPQPTDAFFNFEVTTLYLATHRADLVMNTLYDFLTTMVVASITKVNHTKCCIKANVFVDNVMCTLKARAYQLQEPGKIALEIQKRSGDSITFTGVYRKAAKYLKEQSLMAGFEVAGGLPQESPLGMEPLGLPLSGFPKGKVDVQDYAPLLEMAANTHMPDLQAEAAGALASSTADPDVADALSSDRMAMEDIAMLLEREADRLDIALPAAELVTNLARSPKAPEHFEGLLSPLVWKVQRFPVIPNSHDANYVAKRLFAEALATAIASCRQQLPEHVVGQLAADLHTVMSASKDPMGNPDAAYGNLQTAYFNLVPQAIPA